MDILIEVTPAKMTVSWNRLEQLGWLCFSLRLKSDRILSCRWILTLHDGA